MFLVYWDLWYKLFTKVHLEIASNVLTFQEISNNMNNECDKIFRTLQVVVIALQAQIKRVSDSTDVWMYDQMMVRHL